MRSGAPVKSPSCAPAIRGAATRPESGVQVEKATITASAARDVRHMGQGLEWGDAPTCTGPAQASTQLVQPAPAGELFDQIADHGLGVTNSIQVLSCTYSSLSMPAKPGFLLRLIARTVLA